MKRPRSSRQLTASITSGMEDGSCAHESDPPAHNADAGSDPLDRDGPRPGIVIANKGLELQRSSDDPVDNDFDEEDGAGQQEALDAFSNLLGVGEASSSDDDGPLEVMTVSDLPSSVVKTHRIDEVALERKLQDIALFNGETPGNSGKLPFAESLCVEMPVEQEGPLPADLAVDDLQREETFAKLATAAAHSGLSRLRSESIKFRRPTDYFAEMIKTDEHMTKVKGRLLHEKERIETAQKHRNNRNIRKNRKKVRQAQMEREQAKRQRANEDIADVQRVRKERLRSRSSGGVEAGIEDDDDEFPVDLLDIEELNGDSVKRGQPHISKANVGRKSDKKSNGGRHNGAARRAGARASGDAGRVRFEDISKEDSNGNGGTGFPRNARGSIGDRRGGGRNGKPGTSGRGVRNHTGGIDKPSSGNGRRLGSKKRPGKSRRVKTH